MVCVIHQKPCTVQQNKDLQPWKTMEFVLWAKQEQKNNKTHTLRLSTSVCVCVCLCLCVCVCACVCVCVLKLWIDIYIYIPVQCSTFVCLVARGSYKMPEPTSQKTNQRHLGTQPYFLHKTVSAFLMSSASWSFPQHAHGAISLIINSDSAYTGWKQHIHYALWICPC